MSRLPFAAAVFAVASAGFLVAPASAAAAIWQERAPQDAHADDHPGAAQPRQFELLKRSIAPGRILVIGTTEFVTDTNLCVAETQSNPYLLLNAACYMAAGTVLNVRLVSSESSERWHGPLSNDTKTVLGRLQGDVRLTAYLSTNLPPTWGDTRRDIEEVVRAFSSCSADGHLKAKIVDPDRSGEERSAAIAAGFEPQEVTDGAENEVSVKGAFLGIVVEHGDKSAKLPFIVSADSLEYDLALRIAKVMRDDPVKLAWKAGDRDTAKDKSDPSGRMVGERHAPPADLHRMDEILNGEFDTTTVDLESRVPDDVKVVVLCDVEGMTDLQKFWSDQFLMRGGGLIVLADGSRVQDSGVMPGGEPNRLVRRGNDRLPDDLFSHYGFTINKDVVLDLSCSRILCQGQMVHYPVFIVSKVTSTDQTRPIVANLRNLAFMFASSISLSPKPGVKAVELVHSSERARHLENPMMLSPENLLPASQKEVAARVKEYNSRYVLAGLLEGEFESYFASHPIPKQVLGPESPPVVPGGGDARKDAAGR